MIDYVFSVFFFVFFFFFLLRKVLCKIKISAVPIFSKKSLNPI